VPHAVRKLQPDADGQLPSLGAIFNAIIYQQQTTVDVLRAIAEDHPEQLEEMKELTMTSSVDEEKRKEFTALLDDVMAAVERNTSNSNG
jgi:mannitol/fructose-specific phosphotransferase system IIA component